MDRAAATAVEPKPKAREGAPELARLTGLCATLWVAAWGCGQEAASQDPLGKMPINAGGFGNAGASSPGEAMGSSAGGDGSAMAGGRSGDGVTMTSGGASGDGGTMTSGGASGDGGVMAAGGRSGDGGVTTRDGGPVGSAGAAGSPDAGDSESSWSEGCGKPRMLMNGRVTIQSGGMDRSYILRVPDRYQSDRPYRLVFAYHWLGGDANAVASGSSPFYGLWDRADDTTIFVAPDGVDQGWGNPGGHDVLLTDAILGQIAGELCVDTTRIFATGFSYGGAMSYALACARADTFRAVAVYSAALLSGCDGGTEPIPYFATRGVREPVIDPMTTGRALRDHYADINGCTAQTPPEPGEGSGTHICTSYDGCTEGYPVRWCAFDDGHTASPVDQGQITSWVPDEAWSFLAQF